MVHVLDLDEVDDLVAGAVQPLLLAFTMPLYSVAMLIAWGLA